VPAAILLLAMRTSAQLRFEGFSTDLSGTVSAGYTADYGNETSSDHSWVAGGAGTFSGSFYNPNFLSYNASFYLNQSRANSNFQSISNASGIDISSNIFGGSRFPGAITYSKVYNSEGNYAVPGLADYVTHGNSDTFGINWNENLPGVPSFSAAFQMGNSQYSVYGASDGGKNAFHSLNLHSGYSIEGFNMGAYYSDGGGHSLIPQVVAGQSDTETHSSDDNYGFNVAHRLPMKGSFSANINRSGYGTSYLGYSSSGTIDTVNGSAGIHPTNKFSLSTSANYSDNLSGQLIQSVIAAGGVVPGLGSNESSNSLSLEGVATYAIAPNLQTSAYAERRTQSFLGEAYGESSYGGSATYEHKLLDGDFNSAVTIADNSADQNGGDTLSFATTENYTSQIFGWHLSGSFGYAQNVQTLLITYMNSSYTYTGNLRRRWGRLNFSAGAGGMRTALTQQAGTANTGQNYNASLGYGVWLTSTASFSKSSGQAIATGTGLVPVPVPSPTLPSSLVSLYGGDSYSFSLSSTPAKRLVISASYSKAISNTNSNSIASSNENDQYNALIQYQFRKLYFTSGYARLQQGFSEAGTPPQVISSFYIGVSRWFNFF